MIEGSVSLFQLTFDANPDSTEKVRITPDNTDMILPADLVWLVINKQGKVEVSNLGQRSH